MKMRNIFAITILLIPFLISSVSAQFLGQLTPAPTLSRGDGLWGAYMGVYEDAFSVFGQFRYGVAKYVDLGLKLGMISLDPGYGESNTGLTLGGDIKYWFMERHTGDPLDVSLGVGTEYLNISDFSVFSLGTNIIASYEIEHNPGKSVTPYGRLNLRWERSSFESTWRWPLGWKHAENWRHDDFDVGLALGADLKLSSNLSLIGELEIEDNVGFVAGINYHMF
jgi:hypothetical protein